MRIRLLSTIAFATMLLAFAEQRSEQAPKSGRGVSLTTVAMRAHRIAPMVAFYSQAFGATFREVDARGIRSQFGEVAGITLKLVPIRAEVDFVNFPVTQLGFEVPDVEAVIRMAIKHGGKQEGELIRKDGQTHAAIRDPDGNTIELYSRK